MNFFLLYTLHTQKHTRPHNFPTLSALLNKKIHSLGKIWHRRARHRDGGRPRKRSFPSSLIHWYKKIFIISKSFFKRLASLILRFPAQRLLQWTKVIQFSTHLRNRTKQHVFTIDRFFDLRALSRFLFFFNTTITFCTVIINARIRRNTFINQFSCI